MVVQFLVKSRHQNDCRTLSAESAPPWTYHCLPTSAAAAPPTGCGCAWIGTIRSPRRIERARTRRGRQESDRVRVGIKDVEEERKDEAEENRILG